MSSHRWHPNPARHDPPRAILFDDCPRCAEHAEDPRSLDRDHLTAIVRSLAGELWDHDPTRAEREARAKVYGSLVLVERLTGVPWKTLIETILAVAS